MFTRKRHKSPKYGSLALVAVVLALPVARAGDADLGEAIAGSCVACHGENGAKPITNNPVLAGQHEGYLLQALKEYKSGKRANAVMAAQVGEMTQRDFENLAAYFAGQESPLK